MKLSDLLVEFNQSEIANVDIDTVSFEELDSFLKNETDERKQKVIKDLIELKQIKSDALNVSKKIKERFEREFHLLPGVKK